MTESKRGFLLLVATLGLALVGGVGWAMAGAPGAPSWMMPRGDHHGGGSDMMDATSHGMGLEVAIEEARYHPMMVHVAVGGTVTWTNLDGYAHTVTSEDGLFDSGMLDEGQSFAWTFTQPGTYAYYCIPHSWMDGDERQGQVGTVIVE